MALVAVSFGYGFLHAVGPGHGKMLIGGYGMGSRVRIGPLALIALASSLAQATTAVILVYAGVFVLGWTKDQMVGVAEDVMAPIGYAAVATVGLWLVLRGLRGMRRVGLDAENPQHAAHHDHGRHSPGHAEHGHHHAHGAACDCGHRHGPTLEDVSRLSGWRDAVALIASIALRPCSGALFVLILTWQMGIGATGILAAYAMGIGTASVTLAVAGLAVWARDGALASLPGSGLARAIPLFEIAAGALVALLATDLLIRSI